MPTGLPRFPLQIVIELPRWLREFAFAPAYRTDEEKMRLAVELARRNVEEGTGGPFGAAVFQRATGALVAPGVNLVVPSHAPTAHAEIVALALAGQAAGTHDLSELDGELVTSVEPCAMCLGAVPWSGVRRLVCGAREEDARAVGFDEGSKPDDWPAALEARRIEVVRDVLREEAAAVLEDYRAAGGPIYNPRR